MTASMAEPDSTDLAREILMSYVYEEGEEGLIHIATGLQNLCTVLLIRLERLGVDPIQELQRIGRIPGLQTDD